jgi:hypothetical protein
LTAARASIDRGRCTCAAPGKDAGACLSAPHNQSAWSSHEASCSGSPASLLSSVAQSSCHEGDLNADTSSPQSPVRPAPCRPRADGHPRHRLPRQAAAPRTGSPRARAPALFSIGQLNALCFDSGSGTTVTCSVLAITRKRAPPAHAPVGLKPGPSRERRQDARAASTGRTRGGLVDVSELARWRRSGRNLRLTQEPVRLLNGRWLTADSARPADRAVRGSRTVRRHRPDCFRCFPASPFPCCRGQHRIQSCRLSCRCGCRCSSCC